jgi:hypothetical protein
LSPRDLKVFEVKKGKKAAQRVRDEAIANKAIADARGAFKPQPAPAKVEGKVQAVADDIPISVAENAFRGTSFMPDKRARTWQSYYVNDFNNLAEKFRKLADTDELRAPSRRLARFRRVCSPSTSLLGAHSRVMSR